MTHPLPDDLVELIAERFRALSEPTRIKLLDQLRDGEASVLELSGLIGTTPQNVSKHLGVLQRSGIVARRKQGNFAYYWIIDEGVYSLCEAVCCSLQQQVESLRQLVERERVMLRLFRCSRRTRSRRGATHAAGDPNESAGSTLSGQSILVKRNVGSNKGSQVVLKSAMWCAPPRFGLTTAVLAPRAANGAPSWWLRALRSDSAPAQVPAPIRLRGPACAVRSLLELTRCSWFGPARPGGVGPRLASRQNVENCIVVSASTPTWRTSSWVTFSGHRPAGVRTAPSACAPIATPSLTRRAVRASRGPLS